MSKKLAMSAIIASVLSISLVAAPVVKVNDTVHSSSEAAIITDKGYETIEEIKASFLKELNAYRASKKLHPLKTSIYLEETSKWWSDTLYEHNAFGHHWGDGVWAGEILAKFSGTRNQGKVLFNLWKNSKVHNEIMLKEFYTHVGLGLNAQYLGTTVDYIATARFFSDDMSDIEEGSKPDPNIVKNKIPNIKIHTSLKKEFASPSKVKISFTASHAGVIKEDREIYAKFKKGYNTITLSNLDFDEIYDLEFFIPVSAVNSYYTQEVRVYVGSGQKTFSKKFTGNKTVKANKKATWSKVKLSHKGELQKYNTKAKKWVKVKNLKKGTQNITVKAASKKKVKDKYRIVINKTSVNARYVSKTLTVTSK